jgi:hypothetical protein
MLERERKVVGLCRCLRQGVVRLGEIWILFDQLLQHRRRSRRRRFVGDLRQQLQETRLRVDECGFEQNAQVFGRGLDLVHVKRAERGEAVRLFARLIQLQPMIGHFRDERPLLMLEGHACCLVAQLLVGCTDRGSDVSHRRFAILTALECDLGAQHQRIRIAGQRLPGRRGLLSGFAGGRARRRQ